MTGLPRQPQVPGVRSALEVLHRQALGIAAARLVQQGQRIVRRDKHDGCPATERVKGPEDRTVPDGVIKSMT